MTILSRPIQSTSSTIDGNWTTIAGGTNSFLVQEADSSNGKKTEEGKSTKKVVPFVSTTLDVKSKYRIILSTCPEDFGDGFVMSSFSPARDPANKSGSSNNNKETPAAPVRLAVAVSDSHDQILADWSEIKECWRQSGGVTVVTAAGWENFYQGVLRIRAEEAMEGANSGVADSSSTKNNNNEGPMSSEAFDSDEDDVDDNDLLRRSFSPSRPSRQSGGGGSSSTNAQQIAPSDGVGETRKGRVMSSHDAAATADELSGCSNDDIWAARFFSMWAWRDSYQSALAVCLFAHGYWLRWMNVFTALIIFYILGWTFPKYRPAHRVTAAKGGDTKNSHPNQEDVEDAADAMDAAELRAWVEWVNAFLQKWGLVTKRDVHSAAATLVLLNYILTCFAPKYTLTVIFEEVLFPTIPVVLLASLGYRTLFRKKAIHSTQVQKRTAPTSRKMEGATAQQAPKTIVQGSLDNNERLSNNNNEAPLEEQAADNSTRTQSVPPPVNGSSNFPALITEPLALYHNPGWTKKLERDGVLFEEMPSPYCNKKACRFTTTVRNCTVRSVEKLVDDDRLCNNPKSYAYQFDSLLSSRKLIRRNEKEGTSLVNMMYKSPVFGVSARDMVAEVVTNRIISKREDQEALNIVPASCTGSPFHVRDVFIQSGCDRQNEYPHQNKFVRGAIHRYLLLAQEELNGSVTLTLCMSVDPQGVIPASIVEMTNAEQVKKLIKMRELLAAIGPIKSPETLQAEEEAAKQVAPPSGAQLPALEDLDSALAQPPPRVANAEHPLFQRWLKELYFAGDWQPFKERDGASCHLKVVPWSPKKAVRVERYISNVRAASLDIILSRPDWINKYDVLVRKKYVVQEHPDDHTSIVHTQYTSPVFGVSPRDFVTKVVPRLFLQKDDLEDLGIDVISPTATHRVGAAPLTPAESEAAKEDITFNITAEELQTFCQFGVDASTSIPECKGFVRGFAHLFGLIAQEYFMDAASAPQPGEGPNVRRPRRIGVRYIACASGDPCGKLPVSLVDATNEMQIETSARLAQLMREVTAKPPPPLA